MKLWFRTGEREVPEQLAARFEGINTRVLNYEEALALANRNELSDYLNREQGKVMRAHFERIR